MNRTIKLLLFNILLCSAPALQAMGSLRTFGARAFRAAVAAGNRPYMSSVRKAIGGTMLTGVAAGFVYKKSTQNSVQDANVLPSYTPIHGLKRLYAVIQDAYIPLTQENIKKYPYLKEQFITYAAEHVDILNDDILRSLSQQYPTETVDVFVRKALENLGGTQNVNGKLLQFLDAKEVDNYCKKFPALENCVYYTYAKTYDLGGERISIRIHKGFVDTYYVPWIATSPTTGIINYYIPDEPKGIAEIALLRVPLSMRNKGYGGQLIKKALDDIAQKSTNKRIVKLTAHPHGEQPMTLDTLIKFYQKYGAILLERGHHWASMQFIIDGLEKKDIEKNELHHKELSIHGLVLA